MNVESNQPKGCGGFGQGNFSNLMKAQQAAFNNQKRSQSVQSEPMISRLRKSFPTLIPLQELAHSSLSQLCRNHLDITNVSYISTLEHLESCLEA